MTNTLFFTFSIIFISSYCFPWFLVWNLIGLTLISLSRRPSGEPIEEETAPDTPGQDNSSEQSHERHEQTTTRWYSALEDDNDVWGK